MKKLVSCILMAAVLLSLAACASSDTQAGPSEDPGTSSTVNSEKENGNAAGGEAEQISFRETTVVDNDQCLIRITGIDPDNTWGYTLKAYLENKSADKTYMFSVDSAAVNGVQTSPLFATEVAAGKKANQEIHFSDDALSSEDIGVFTDIELSFRVYDSNDWTADEVACLTAHIYPYGEEKATAFVRATQPTDTVLVDNEAVTVLVTDYEQGGFWGYTVNLYLQNKTQKNLTFAVDEASVNSFMADPFWASSVNAGKAAFTSMSWSDSTLEENGITSVEEIELKLRIYDADDWFAADLFNETVTLKP